MEFAWDWATGVPEMLSEGGNLYLVGHETLGRWDGGAWAYYLPDAPGSLRQVADGAGAVVSAREWTPYGVEVGATQAGPGYARKWWDAEVGLVYLRARWYDGRTGRFTQRDPLPGFPFPGTSATVWIPDEWELSLVRATPPRAQFYHFTISWTERERILVGSDFSWYRPAAWWEGLF